MRRYGKARVLALIGCAVTGMALLGAVTVCWAANCKKPDPNTSLCLSPPADAVLDCGTVGNQPDCLKFSVYQILNFPNGPVANPTGYTVQNQRDCWRSRNCRWNGTATPSCYADPTWGAWHPKGKTEVGGTCPNEG